MSTAHHFSDIFQDGAQNLVDDWGAYRISNEWANGVDKPVEATNTHIVRVKS